MSLPLVRYQLDPTGINPDNAVVGEVKTLALTQVRTVAPTYGPFFTESLVIYDNTNNRLLARGVDYQCVELLQTATAKFGKEIAALILIINPTVGGEVRMNYQVLGGLYQNNVDGIVDMYNTFLLDDRPVDWSNVLNKPYTYPPSLHNHLITDVYGFEPIIVALERIRNAIILSDVPAFEALIEWVKRRSASCMIINPVVPTVRANDNKRFFVETSNRRNNARFFWIIKAPGLDSTYFTAMNGFFDIYQNHSEFEIQVSNKTPIETNVFDIEIRDGSLTGPVVTTIEGITFYGRALRSGMSMARLLVACCPNNPSVPRNARSFYVLGDH